MTKVIVETANGERTDIIVSGNPDVEDIDAEYLNERTNPDVDIVEIIEIRQSVSERVQQLESATGSTGAEERGIANRIDDLEDRIVVLEDGE